MPVILMLDVVPATTCTGEATVEPALGEQIVTVWSAGLSVHCAAAGKQAARTRKREERRAEDIHKSVLEMRKFPLKIARSPTINSRFFSYLHSYYSCVNSPNVRQGDGESADKSNLF